MNQPAPVTRAAFRFFLDHASYCTPPGRATCAIDNARAEAFAAEHGYTYEWVPDDDADLGEHAYWCPTARHARNWDNGHRRQRVHFQAFRRVGRYWQPHGRQRGAWTEIRRPTCDHYAEGCIMRDASDRDVNSLWGIIDADRDYRRVVQAELAGEAYDAWTLYRAEQQDLAAILADDNYQGE